MNEALKSVRVLVLFFFIVLSLALVSNIIPVNKDNGWGFGNGLRYGLDFAGGTLLQLKLGSEATPEVMAVEKTILENRLNSMGLKDIPVRPWGSQYIIIQIADATPAETENIENILRQQARFEERIDGTLAAKGNEVTVDLGPQGAELYNAPGGGYRWAVRVQHNKEGACRFGNAGDGKEGRPVDIFIDRPENTTIVFTEANFQLMGNLTETQDTGSFFFGNTALEVLTNRSVIPVLSYSTNGSDVFDRLTELRSQGYDRVMLAGDEGKIPDDLRNRLEEQGFRTSRMPMGNKTYPEWIAEMTGLKNSLNLAFDPRGECVYQAIIEGTTQTLDSARAEIQTTQVLLTSGNLPVELTLESKSTTPPTLGRRFLMYSFYTGLVAIAAVATIMYIRYRRIEIVAPVMLTMMSEIVIILGMASLIKWELDLPAVAGIIATVGTGVDHQIVITDETLKRTLKTKKTVSIAERIRKAFFIVLTAGSTVVAAMIPLLGIGSGMLKGFAFTTMMGVFIGVIITRSAYAKIIESILRKEE